MEEQPGLFESLCNGCVAHRECGGASMAPCECVYDDFARRHHCEVCSIVCRSRRSGRGDIANDYFLDGRALSDLHIASRVERLPTLIPARTAVLTSEINAAVVAALPRDLLRWRPGAQVAQPFKRLRDPEAFRRRLRVSARTTVIAVLNARDDFLEAIWQGKRQDFYSALRSAGISAVTGPTFSILNESNDLPAFHNVTMARRHNKAIQEIYDAGLTVIPNVYWRNETAIHEWAEHIRGAPIDTISRDFSLTKQRSAFEHHLEGLARLLESIARPIQVILVGIGPRKARATLERLKTVGATCSFVSSAPIMFAVKRGHELRATEDGRLAEIRDLNVSRGELAISNLNTFQDFLLDAVNPQDRRPNARFAYRQAAQGMSAA